MPASQTINNQALTNIRLDELWKRVLAEIELEISSANFETWFKDTFIYDIDGASAMVVVPNNFTREWLENRYHKFIIKSLRNFVSDIKKIDYIVKNDLERKVKKLKQRKYSIPVSEQLIFEEITIDPETNINPKYVFDNFIVGPFNELAHAASIAVIENLGRKYNPLFVYGGVGLGKTHLLHSIGNQVKELYGPKIKIKYVTSEKFTTELVNAIRQSSTRPTEIEEFKNRYRQLDVFLIDDVQFISGKDKTQEELFHIFNNLYGQNKQIIFSSDRPPKAIPDIEERLRSRFEGGMMADINFPDFETRIAILKSKLQNQEIAVPDEILHLIAEKITKNIRELEGTLNRVIAMTKTKRYNPGDLKEVEKIVEAYISPYIKTTNWQKIIKEVAIFYNIAEKDLLKKSRKKDDVKPRQIVMYLFREELKSSFPFIGEKMGGKDHTTVIHAYKKIKNELSRNQLLSQEINLIKEKIYA